MLYNNEIQRIQQRHTITTQQHTTMCSTAYISLVKYTALSPISSSNPLSCVSANLRSSFSSAENFSFSVFSSWDARISCMLAIACLVFSKSPTKNDFA